MCVRKNHWEKRLCWILSIQPSLLTSLEDSVFSVPVVRKCSDTRSTSFGYCLKYRVVNLYTKWQMSDVAILCHQQMQPDREALSHLVTGSIEVDQQNYKPPYCCFFKFAEEYEFQWVYMNGLWYSLNRSMDSDKYLEGQSMQRPPLFESDCFIYWRNRFETYVKAKDLNLWHIILNGDFPLVARNKDTQVLEVVPFEEQSDDLKKKLAKNNEAKMFLRALHPKWRVKVTTIEESKDLSSLDLDEFIGNLKVHEVVMEKDSKIYRGKKEKVKSSDLKAKKESSDDETCLMAQSSNEVTLNSSYYSDNAFSLDNDKLKLENARLKETQVKFAKFDKSANSLREMLNNQKISSCKIGLGFDSSKASTSGTQPINFVGSSAEIAPDESTIKAHGSTIPGSVDPSSGEKAAEHVFSPPMSSRSDFVITRKKLIHNKIEESKKPSLQPSLKGGLKDLSRAETYKTLEDLLKVLSMDGVAFGSPSNIPLVARINALESQITEGKLLLLDDDGKPLNPSASTLPSSYIMVSKRVDVMVKKDNDREVEEENHGEDPYDNDDFDDPGLTDAQMKFAYAFDINLRGQLR
ncbi:hypothetical protein Tco_0924944 [Tanacetum coccineum]|uniref:Uncharacterized protein n=1 Tax=Tanacetum coccineum TaxID=301880 RepID=A0ABQ5D6R3_9ASTR